MSEKKSAAPIRLGSRTAVALKKSAGKVRVACLAVGVVASAGLFALAVFLGLRWLPAVPLVVAAAAFFDVILYVHGERVALSLTSLALSAEQASRALREEAREDVRRKTREEDEAEIRKDLENRLSGAREPVGAGTTLSATRVAGKGGKEAAARRARPIERIPENEEAGESPRRRRRNAKPGLTLIEGSKKG